MKMLEIVGQVVVYSVTGCPHCLTAKKTLKDSGIPFIDVPVDRFPAVRSWLQVFIYNIIITVVPWYMSALE